LPGRKIRNSDGIGVFEEGDDFVGEEALLLGELKPGLFEAGSEFGADLVNFAVDVVGAGGGGFVDGEAVFLHFAAEFGEGRFEFVDAGGEGLLGILELFGGREAGPGFAAFEEVVDLVDGDAEGGEGDDEPADAFVGGGV